MTPIGDNYQWQACDCDNPGPYFSGAVAKDSETRITTDCFGNVKYRIKPQMPWQYVDRCDDLDIVSVACQP